MCPIKHPVYLFNYLLGIISVHLVAWCRSQNRWQLTNTTPTYSKQNHTNPFVKSHREINFLILHLKMQLVLYCF